MAIDQITHAATDTAPRKTSRWFGQYIINMKFQFKFTLVVFSFLAIMALLIYLEGHIAVNSMIKSGAVTGEESIQQLRLINSIIGKTCILGLAITFGLSLFFSHFVAGPIYRFQKTLEEMQAGKLNVHVQLRKRDELKEVAISFNQALSSLRNRLRREREGINSSLEKALLVVARLQKEGRAADAHELQELINDIKNNPHQIEI